VAPARSTPSLTAPARAQFKEPAGGVCYALVMAVDTWVLGPGTQVCVTLLKPVFEYELIALGVSVDK
jgi:hypothetical protein